MRRKNKRVKPKYRIGQTVYCRPWLRLSGLSVYKCLITQVNQIGLFVIYESEISRRKERLIKEATKALDKKFSPYIDWLNYYLLQLQELQ